MPQSYGISRRQMLAAGAAAPWAWSAATAVGADAPAAAAQAGPPAQIKPDHTFDLGREQIAPVGAAVEATLVNGMLPGPELRYREGDMLRVLVNNRLPVPTTVHWHGMIVPNYMDGVPGVTQAPIGPNESVFYEYPLRQHGTYWYHSHYEFQEQTGLSGPLVIEPRHEPHAYDHDVVVYLSDWLDQEPKTVIPQLRGEEPTTSATAAAPAGGLEFPPGKPFEIDVNYPGYLLNGRPGDDPWRLAVRRGDRVRLRIINGSTATFFRIALDGHELELIAADGQPVEPTQVSNLVAATAERYDVLVTVKESGSFTLHAAALGTGQQALGVLHTPGAAPQVNRAMPDFGGRSGGMANYAALRSPYPTRLADGPVRSFDIALGGKMKQYLWTINGELYPEPFAPQGKATPLVIRAGERVRMRLSNSTMMFHPIHLHGHFFRLLPQPGAWDAAAAPLKDSLGIGPMQKIDIEFMADNPGRWFFHCHNLYHLAAGMARVVQYDV